jgi:hypothetical protein
MMWHFFCCLLPYSKQQRKKKEKERRKQHNDDNHYKLLRRSSTLVLCMHFECALLAFYIDKMYQSITCVNFLGDLSVLSHTHMYTLLAFFFLTYFSSSFHLIVHPHNFLIRFAGRTREYSAARRLLFFCMQTQADA